MCRGHRRTCERLWNFSLSSLWKKKWHRNKELTTVEFVPGTAGSEITELPTKPRGFWPVQLIEKAICLWFLCPVLLSLSCSKPIWWIWASAVVFRCQHVELHLQMISVARSFFCRPEMEAGIEHFYRTSVNSCTLFPFSSFPKIIVSPE